MYVTVVYVHDCYYYIPDDFARIASLKMMSDFHMLRMNVCEAGSHAGTQIHKNVLTFLILRAWHARALDVQDRLFVTQTGRDAETRKRVEIYKSGGL